MSFLEKWRGDRGHEHCDKVLKDSSQIGTSVHESIENFLTTGEIDERNEPFIRSFKKWKEEIGFEPLVLEPKEPLIGCTKIKQHPGDSCDGCFQGTFDAIGLIDGETVLADWKTSSRMSITNGLQLSAYAFLTNQVDGRKINKGWIVRLDKKTHKVEALEYKNLESYFEVFKGLIPAYYYTHELRQWA